MPLNNDNGERDPGSIPAPGRSAFDLDRFLSMPRVGGLRLSPDGRRLITTVQEPTLDGKRFFGAIWELDPTGERPPRRLTRSKKGEGSPEFTRDGSILFTSARPDNEERAEIDKGDEDRARLWILPADGEEPRVLAGPPNGVSQAVAARDADVLVVRAGRWPGAETDDADAERSKTRKDKGVGAQLFDRYPIRYWDHYLPTATPRLFAGSLPEAGDLGDLTPDAGPALMDVDDTEFDVAPDGSIVVSTWLRDVSAHEFRVDLVVIDVATGDRRTVAHGEGADFVHPAISPDGTRVAAVRWTVGNPDEAARQTLWLFDLASGEGVRTGPGLRAVAERPGVGAGRLSACSSPRTRAGSPRCGGWTLPAAR